MVSGWCLIWTTYFWRSSHTSLHISIPHTQLHVRHQGGFFLRRLARQLDPTREAGGDGPVSSARSAPWLLDLLGSGFLQECYHVIVNVDPMTGHENSRVMDLTWFNICHQQTSGMKWWFCQQNMERTFPVQKLKQSQTSLKDQLFQTYSNGEFNRQTGISHAKQTDITWTVDMSFWI